MKMLKPSSWTEFRTPELSNRLAHLPGVVGTSCCFNPLDMVMFTLTGASLLAVDGIEVMRRSGNGPTLLR